MALEDSKNYVDEAFTRKDMRGVSFENTFGGATSFLRRRYTKDLTGVDIAVTGIPFDQADIERIQFGALQKLPVGSGDLMPEYEGKELGKRLKEIEKIWIGSEFRLTREDLLRH